MTRTTQSLALTLATVIVVFFFSAPAQADTMQLRIKARWKTTFVDGGVGEDYDSYTGSYGYVKARHAIYDVKCNGQLLEGGAGTLSNTGRTPWLEAPTYANCQLKVYTALKHSSYNRFVFVYDTYQSPYYSWATIDFQTSTGPQDITLNVTTTLPVFNAAAVAGMYLYRGQSGFPASCTFGVGVLTSSVCERTEYDLDGVIDGVQLAPWGWPAVCIARDYNGVDHSNYKFVIAHELGHHQAHFNDGPLHGSDQFTADAADPWCRCDYKADAGADAGADGGSVPAACYQSLEYIGGREKEGWAEFYGALIYNNRSANSCHKTHWASVLNPTLYPSYPTNPEQAQISPPAHVNCGAYEKWSNYCDYSVRSHKGTLTEWLRFFWKVWSSGGSNKFEILELSDVWANTGYEHGYEGEQWRHLLSTVLQQYGTDMEKVAHFVDRGLESGAAFYQPFE